MASNPASSPRSSAFFIASPIPAAQTNKLWRAFDINCPVVDISFLCGPQSTTRFVFQDMAFAVNMPNSSNSKPLVRTAFSQARMAFAERNMIIINKLSVETSAPTAPPFAAGLLSFATPAPVETDVVFPLSAAQPIDRSGTGAGVKTRDRNVGEQTTASAHHREEVKTRTAIREKRACYEKPSGGSDSYW